MKVAVAPGRFSMSPESLAADLARWTAEASVVGTSEVGAPNRAAALPVGGWTLTHDSGPGKGECAILTKDSRWKVLEQKWVELLPAGSGPGRLKQPLVAPVVVAESVATGHVVVFSMAHLPAHVEGMWALIPLRARTKARLLRKSKRARVRTYVEAVGTWRSSVTHLAAKHHADDVVVMADWNINAQKKWVQAFLNHVWHGLDIAASKKGDMGSRTIGYAMTSMRLVSARVEQSRGSDHNTEILELAHINDKPVEAPKPVEKPPEAFDLCTYNGARMDNKTAVFVQCCEKDLGYSLTILQGCYNAGGVSASAGTHDGGGVVDLAPFDFANKVTTARKRGGFFWHRLALPGVWGEHIHGGIRNQGRLSPSAADQQNDYDGKPPRDGLAGHSIDNTFHPAPPVGFDYSSAWREING